MWLECIRERMNFNEEQMDRWPGAKSCYRKIYRLRIIPRRGYDGSPDSTTYRNYRFINRAENKI